MSELSKTLKGCACTQDLTDLLRAYTAKKDSLRKVTSTVCGKVFLTNAEMECCFNCNVKQKEKQEGNDFNGR